MADEGLVKLEEDYFDWNEVRVTTVTELAGVLSSLPDPQKAASRLKANLQSIFEEFYSFDLEHLKKENLGKAVGKFEKMPSMTPFVLSYLIQHGLGGHSIPIDYSGMVIMLVTGIATQNEAATGRVPGLERAIPKSKGMEFAALLHQPAVALTADPNDKDARKLLESVAKGSSKGLDEWLVSKKAAKKRVAKRKAEEREVAKQEAIEAAELLAAKKPVAGKKKPVRSAAKSTSTTHKPRAAKTASKPATAKTVTPKKTKTATEEKPASKATEKPAPDKKATKKSATKSSSKDTTKKATASKASASKTTPAKKKATGKATPSKSSSAAKSKSETKGKTANTKKSAGTKKSSTAAGKKATNRKLSKRKPR